MLERLTEAAFGQRRKMLRQSLKGVPGADQHRHRQSGRAGRAAGALAEAFARCPARSSWRDPAPVTAIARRWQRLRQAPRPASGGAGAAAGQAAHPADRAHGHGVSRRSPFQQPDLARRETLNGPGVADMKGGIAVMLHALLAFEQTASASALGYDVLINSDEETGSLASAR
jgi:glutamate carboxypeptidase